VFLCVICPLFIVLHPQFGSWFRLHFQNGYTLPYRLSIVNFLPMMFFFCKLVLILFLRLKLLRPFIMNTVTCYYFVRNCTRKTNISPIMWFYEIVEWGTYISFCAHCTVYSFHHLFYWCTKNNHFWKHLLACFRTLARVWLFLNSTNNVCFWKKQKKQKSLYILFGYTAISVSFGTIKPRIFNLLISNGNR